MLQSYLLCMLVHGMVPPGGAAFSRVYAKGVLRSLPPLYAPGVPGGEPANMTLEHVVPRFVLRDTPGAARDLHNIFCTPAALNQARGCRRLGERPPGRACSRQDEGAFPTRAFPTRAFPTRGGRYGYHLGEGRYRYVGHGNFIDREGGAFCLNPAHRGVVARAVLHMARRWECDPTRVVEGGEATLWRWHAAFPPGPDELLHNHLVLRMQSETNTFISNETDPLQSLHEIHRSHKTAKPP